MNLIADSLKLKSKYLSSGTMNEWKTFSKVKEYCPFLTGDRTVITEQGNPENKQLQH